jgi:hypothetical protein
LLQSHRSRERAFQGGKLFDHANALIRSRRRLERRANFM